MEVILVKPVRKLGTIGSVVIVKDGFGRNFLIPQGFAVRATSANKKIIEDRKIELEAQDAEAKVLATSLKSNVEGTAITFIVQAAADGRLFGSVGAKEIVKELSKKGHKIEHSHVELVSAIKSLGVINVPLTLHHEVESFVIVNIARSESEATEALIEFKNAKNDNSAIQEEITESVA